MKLRVTAPLLNIRRDVPAIREDNFIGNLTAGTEFFVDTEVTGEKLEGIDRWFKDHQNRFYWGGGAEEIQDTVQSGKKDWGFTDFNIESLWAQTKGERVKVAILDSGLKLNHPEFSSKAGITYYNALTDGITAADCDDVDGHGTNCAGILCAAGQTAFGVAPNIELMVVKVMERENGVQNQHVVKGLEKAIAANAEIISISLSLVKDPVLDKIQQTITAAAAKNIIVVAAAGNSGSVPFPVDKFPAAFTECLSVGGINRSKFRSRFSSKSNTLKIMGPGEDVQGFFAPASRLNGTSFSTPFVAGAVALLLSAAKAKGKTLSVETIHAVLKQTASKDIPGNAFSSVEYGWGLLNAVDALNQLNLT